VNPREAAIAQRMVAARRRAGITQAELAELLKVDVRTVRRWESNVSAGFLRMLPAIAGALSVPLSELRASTTGREESERLDDLVREVREARRAITELISLCVERLGDDGHPPDSIAAYS
jgi:transcriptional regulator with XRE-family HTH domain